MVIVGVVVSVIVGAIVWWLVSVLAIPQGQIDGGQFGAVRIGESRQRVLANLGPPVGDSAAEAAAFGPAPAGQQCDYYRGIGFQDYAYYRLCYANDVLKSKAQNND